jgi:hypothetical protein
MRVGEEAAMDAGSDKLFVDPAMLSSGAESSRQAAEHAATGALHLSGRAVGGDMFGSFPAATAFADAVRGAHAEHVRLLEGHHENLGNVAGNADTVAAAFTDMDHRSAAAFEAIRCNSET